MKNERAQNLAYDWMKWLCTRRLFGPPPPKHILAILSMPDSSGEAPDAALSADMQAFHASVASLPDSIGRAFIRVYCGVPNTPIKTLAFEEGIERNAYYARAHQGASQALRGMALIKAHSLLRVS